MWKTKQVYGSWAAEEMGFVKSHSISHAAVWSVCTCLWKYGILITSEMFENYYLTKFDLFLVSFWYLSGQAHLITLNKDGSLFVVNPLQHESNLQIVSSVYYAS